VAGIGGGAGNSTARKRSRHHGILEILEALAIAAALVTAEIIAPGSKGPLADFVKR
jgi:hypothetical protein